MSPELTFTQAQVLAAFAALGNATNRQVIAHTGMRDKTVRNCVSDCRNLKLLARTNNPTAREAVHRITAPGQARVGNIRPLSWPTGPQTCLYVANSVFALPQVQHCA